MRDYSAALILINNAVAHVRIAESLNASLGDDVPVSADARRQAKRSLRAAIELLSDR